MSTNQTPSARSSARLGSSRSIKALTARLQEGGGGGESKQSGRESQRATLPMARSDSVPAFSSRSEQLSARYESGRYSERDNERRNRTLLAQNTARSVIDTTRSASLRVTLGYTERRPKDQEPSKVDPLWWYNAKRSKQAPLKSTFIDPEQVAKLNNHKSQKELRRTVKRSTIPHITYDIDGDGVVNQTDMRVARMIDVKGKGTLTWDEREEGQQLLAKRFLEYNKGQRWLKHVAPQFADKPVEEAALDVANAEDFARTMFMLNQKSKPGNGRAGRGAIACTSAAYHGWGPDEGQNDPLIKTMVPSSSRGNTARNMAETGLPGFRRAKSRSELFETRKKAALALSSTYAPYKGDFPPSIFRRVDLMTSKEAWNRCNDTTKGMCSHIYGIEKQAVADQGANLKEKTPRPQLVLKFPSKVVG